MADHKRQEAQGQGQDMQLAQILSDLVSLRAGVCVSYTTTIIAPTHPLCSEKTSSSLSRFHTQTSPQA